MAVLSLRRSPTTQPPAQSPERVALAERIANRDAARARLAALRGVTDRGWRDVLAARDARDQAANAVERAGPADARAVTDALIAGTERPAPTLQAARAALVAAEDALAAAPVARDTVNADIAELDKSEPLRASLARDAAAAVFQAEALPAVHAVMEELDALYKQVADKGLALVALVNHDIISDVGPGAIPGLLELTSRINNLSVQWPWCHTPAASPTAAAWMAVVTALEADAAAPAVPA